MADGANGSDAGQAPGLLRWQFDMTWALFEYHLERIEAEDFLWGPAELCWTLHRAADGTWMPDWAPSPSPSPYRRSAG